MSTDQIAKIDRKIKELQQRRELLVAASNMSLWDTLPGYEISRRAIEVAAVGEHSICFLAEDMHGVVLTALATQMGVRATHTALCPCGHFCNPYRWCDCTPVAIRRFHNTKAFQTKLNYDMVVNELYADCPAFAQHAPELRKKVLARIAEAILRNAVYVESTDVRQLLRMAQSDAGLSDATVGRIICIAVSIAKLSGLLYPGVPEFCEAVQYQTERRIAQSP